MSLQIGSCARIREKEGLYAKEGNKVTPDNVLSLVYVAVNVRFLSGEILTWFAVKYFFMRVFTVVKCLPCIEYSSF